MHRTRTSIALVTAAMCATVLVSNAGAETTAQTSASQTPAAQAAGNLVTVTETVTSTPTTTVTSLRGITPRPSSSTSPTTTPLKSDTRSILQAFSSRDFSEVSTPAVILFVLSIITALLNAAVRIDPAQVDAVINQVRAQLPF